jgi:uncharacterized protein YxeA
MKKKIFISLGVLASIGLGYFIYKKIKDRNKEIIEDGGFTIKVADDATTSETETSIKNDSSDYLNSEYYSDSTSASEYPSWSSSDTEYGDY